MGLWYSRLTQVPCTHQSPVRTRVAPQKNRREVLLVNILDCHSGDCGFDPRGACQRWSFDSGCGNNRGFWSPFMGIQSFAEFYYPCLCIGVMAARWHQVRSKGSNPLCETKSVVKKEILRLFRVA